jgi:lipopolysaccharide cholinephosphotransferase
MSFNLNEEVIDGHLVTAETKKLWAVEMDLAQKLLDVCKKYRLRIWATGGTLLGAVRHKGFIPWDDDMDFCMMREDYDKLIELVPNEFSYPYFFQSFYSDKHFWGGMAKIRRSDTAMIEKGYQYHKNFNRGIFIDVLVLDAIPSDRNKLNREYKELKFFRRILLNYRLVNAKHFSLYGKLRHALIYASVALLGPMRIQNRIKCKLSKNTIFDNDYCALLDFYALERYDISKMKFRNKHYYDETVWLPFHDMKIPVPKEYDALLRDLFGDYMKPVKGTQSHDNIIVDTERSFKEVLAELRNKQ